MAKAIEEIKKTGVKMLRDKKWREENGLMLKEGNVMTLSDSLGLSAIDQQWLNLLWNEEMMTLASLTHTP